MTQKAQIILVDDDQDVKAMVEEYLRAKGFEVFTYSSAQEALNKIPNNALIKPDVVLSDIRMPGMDGLEFTTEFKKQYPDTPVILMTAFASIDTAIDAIKRGAFDYLIKPFKLAALEALIEKSLRFKQLEFENKILKKHIRKSQGALGELIGKSPSMQEVFNIAQRVAPSLANVFIMGESGTGKEMIAKSIHELSSRKDAPFISVNCTSIPEPLLESELFGEAAGRELSKLAKKGIFEQASGGTLYLDEIGNLDMNLQTKLLRVIQDKKIKPVGNSNFIDIDIRIIASTNKDIRQNIRNGHFREDLYYRLSVVPITLPPLRYRQEDIPPLAEHFCEKYSAINGLPIKTLTNEAMSKLLSHSWEGNVRELENVIERAVVMTRGLKIEAKDIDLFENTDVEKFFGVAIADNPTLSALEKKYIQYILTKTGGKKEKAAQILGINRRTLYRKEREYGFVETDPRFEEQNEAMDT